MSSAKNSFKTYLDGIIAVRSLGALASNPFVLLRLSWAV